MSSDASPPTAPPPSADLGCIGVGMLGHAFMGKAHVNGYRTLSYMTWPPALLPELICVAGRDEAGVAGSARAAVLPPMPRTGTTS